MDHVDRIRLILFSLVGYCCYTMRRQAVAVQYQNSGPRQFFNFVAREIHFCLRINMGKS